MLHWCKIIGKLLLFRAACTICAGELQIPQETLYKKNVLLMRGRFRPFTLLHNDMLQGKQRKAAMPS